MAVLTIKSKGSCRFDALSLGEVMLRLDPGIERIHTTRHFRAWEGGGEYNVARGLRKCFGMRTAIVTAFADNAIGRLVGDLILQGGVDDTFIKWAPFDGIGETVRNGINFTERGFGVRGALGVSDRGHTAVSQLKPGDIDWEFIFGEHGVRWFHTGGIFAALSETTTEVVQEAMEIARKHGTIVSYDLNYRPSLWKRLGGKPKAREVNRRLAPFVDVMLGNEEDFSACLGFDVEGVDENLSTLPIAGFKRMIEQAVSVFPNFKVAATTLRAVKTASYNDWGAICWAEGKFHSAPTRENLEILDRVGGGDSFASGLIYGLMIHNDAQTAVEYGAAHGALAMTTPGDTTMATFKEVEKLAAGGSARVDR
ncbi:MAG: sugar kinase [Desulfobacterales bacterium]|nr:sugar kinase [Desulfobacterales bacterium]